MEESTSLQAIWPATRGACNVTPPGSGWTLEWSGGADPSYGAGVSATTDGIAVVDISQSGPWGNPSIRVRDAAQVLYAGPIGSQS